MAVGERELGSDNWSGQELYTCTVSSHLHHIDMSGRAHDALAYDAH